MRFHIEACSKSVLTVAEYCSRNGLVKSGYYYWYKKLTGDNKASGFIPVSVEQNPGTAPVEVIYPNGVRLSFSGDINIGILKQLVCCI